MRAQLAPTTGDNRSPTRLSFQQNPPNPSRSIWGGRLGSRVYNIHNNNTELVFVAKGCIFATTKRWDETPARGKIGKSAGMTDCDASFIHSCNVYTVYSSKRIVSTRKSKNTSNIIIILGSAQSDMLSLAASLALS
jgi:hypothetical protein